jgi:hypothetical protein
MEISGGLVVTGGFGPGPAMSADQAPIPIPNTEPTFTWTFGSLDNLNWGTNNNINANVTWGRRRYWETEFFSTCNWVHAFTTNNQISLPPVWYAAPNSSANLYLSGTSGYSPTGGKKLNNDETNVLLNAMTEGTEIDFYSYNYPNPASLVLTSNVVNVYPYAYNGYIIRPEDRLYVANVNISYKDGINDNISEVPDNRSFIVANTWVYPTGNGYSPGAVGYSPYGSAEAYFSPTYEWFMYGTANIKLKTDVSLIFKKYANVISGDSNLSVGSTAIWNSNTYFYAPRGNIALGGNEGVFGYPYIPWRHGEENLRQTWQLFYAHKHIKISPAINSWGMITYPQDFYTSEPTDNSNTSLYGIVSPSFNKKNDWGSNVILRLNKLNMFRSTSGTTDLYTANTDVVFDIPANRYFLLGIYDRPSRHFRLAPNNYTAVNVEGDPVVTAVNEAYVLNEVQGYPITPSTLMGVPNQLGGNVSGYRKLSSNIHYSAFRFEEL